MLNTVTIVGMGALGILVGDAFVKGIGADNVRFLAEGDRLERYRRDGAWCNGEKCDFRFSDGTDGEAELLIFSVKAPDLEDAMRLAEPCIGENTVILSLLNGISSEEILGDTFGHDKILYTVTQSADAVRTENRLTYHSQGDIFVGLPSEDYFDRDEKLDEVEELFHRAGVPFTREDDIEHRMWCKFMLNVGVNQVCMAYELTYGGVQVPGEARDLMIAAMDEVRKIGACQGVLVTRKDMDEYLGLVDAIASEAMPSMRQDGLAGRPSEVELFSGTIIQMADRFGMKVPVNQMLYERIKKMESTAKKH